MILLLALALVLTGCGTPKPGVSLTERLHNHVVRSLNSYYAPEAVERRKQWRHERTAEALRDRGRRDLVDYDSETRGWVLDEDRIERRGNARRYDEDTWRIDGQSINERWVDPEDLAEAIDKATR